LTNCNKQELAEIIVSNFRMLPKQNCTFLKILMEHLAR
jgi:hypothetical protein